LLKQFTSLLDKLLRNPDDHVLDEFKELMILEEPEFSLYMGELSQVSSRLREFSSIRWHDAKDFSKSRHRSLEVELGRLRQVGLDQVRMERLGL